MAEVIHLRSTIVQCFINLKNGHKRMHSLDVAVHIVNKTGIGLHLSWHTCTLALLA